MNREEAAYALAIMKINWPGSYSHMSNADAQATVALWADLFSDEPAELVQAAIKAIMLEQPEREFAPPIGAVKARAYRLMHPDELTAQEAWVLVSKAVSGCDMQNPSKEFGKLPPAVQRAVGSPSQLREWGMVSEDIFGSVIASNFRKAWETQQRREREQALLPNEMRQMISGLAQSMAMLPQAEEREEENDIR